LLLRINLTWSQFEALYRTVAPTQSDGMVRFEDFFAAFRRNNRFGDVGETSSPLHRSSDMRSSLFKICETLTRSKVDLTQLFQFQAFDRNGSGLVSVSEFASMMRTLCPELSQRQVFDLMRCIDNDFDRSISREEFLQFWIVVFSRWLETLKAKLRRSGAGAKRIRLGNDHTLSATELADLIRRVKNTLRLTFGSSQLGDRAEELPGPFAPLLRQAGFGGEDRLAGGVPARTRKPISGQSAARSAGLGATRARANPTRWDAENVENFRERANASIRELLGDATSLSGDSPCGSPIGAVRAARRRKAELDRLGGDSSSTRRSWRQNSSIGTVAKLESASRASRRQSGVAPAPQHINAQVFFPNDAINSP